MRGEIQIKFRVKSYEINRENSAASMSRQSSHGHAGRIPGAECEKFPRIPTHVYGVLTLAQNTIMKVYFLPRNIE